MKQQKSQNAWMHIVFLLCFAVFTSCNEGASGGSDFDTNLSGSTHLEKSDFQTSAFSDYILFNHDQSHVVIYLEFFPKNMTTSDDPKSASIKLRIPCLDSDQDLPEHLVFSLNALPPGAQPEKECFETIEIQKEYLKHYGFQMPFEKASDLFLESFQITLSKDGFLDQNAQLIEVGEGVSVTLENLFFASTDS